MSPELLQGIVLGVVQGLAEFLPISSSGHLIIVPWLFGWRDPGLTFDVALHLGTATAVLGYFRHDWMALARGFVAGLRGAVGRRTPEWRLAWLILLASVPGAVLGVLLERPVEQLLRNPVLVAVSMLLFGLVLWLVDRRATRCRDLGRLGWRDSMLIGLSQALALVPGVSRSGATMTAALALGLTRDAAARFSFLLGTPIILGAGLYKLRDVPGSPMGAGEGAIFLGGMLGAAVAGWLVIGVLLRWLRSGSMAPFVVYRAALAALVLATAVIRGG